MFDVTQFVRVVLGRFVDGISGKNGAVELVLCEVPVDQLAIFDSRRAMLPNEWAVLPDVSFEYDAETDCAAVWFGGKWWCPVACNCDSMIESEEILGVRMKLCKFCLIKRYNTCRCTHPGDDGEPCSRFLRTPGTCWRHSA
jgi:hypothetical protein